MTGPGRKAAQPDPLPWLGRLLSPGPSATADLYFRLSHADLLASGQIECHAPTVFRWQRTLIVVRHDGGLARLPAHDRLVLVVDDDWRGGLGDANLPLWYRLQLGLRDGRAARRLEVAADVIVASCEALAATVRNRRPTAEVAVIEPAWNGPRADISAGIAPGRKVAVLGAASHRGDSRWIAPVLAALVEAKPDVSLLWSGNHSLPATLANRVDVTTVPTLNWDGYRRWIAGARADVGLYPLRPGAFNRARSINKLGEYDRLGAAVVGSDAWTSAAEAARAGACLLVPANRAQWLETLLGLLDHPDRTRALARRNRAWLALRDGQRQRSQWAALLARLGHDASRGSGPAIRST
jgi:hypothetical protein